LKLKCRQWDKTWGMWVDVVDFWAIVAVGPQNACNIFSRPAHIVDTAKQSGGARVSVAETDRERERKRECGKKREGVVEQWEHCN